MALMTVNEKGDRKEQRPQFSNTLNWRSIRYKVLFYNYRYRLFMAMDHSKENIICDKSELRTVKKNDQCPSTSRDIDMDRLSAGQRY